MIKINKSKNKERWFDYDEDVKFLIRPFPLSQRALTPSGMDLEKVLLKQASYTLVDWQGIVDEDDNPVKCTDENKEFVLDYSQDLVIFICEKSKEINDELVKVNTKKN